ncbi:hypothetical protein MAM1_0027c02184 [Mucor ambiguus]|uniref:Uncharacterized protein n=1 Tax=Mucor ambiguus TaxID=91626 RepID=A0A0C9MI53_9FUNG|nr:hypothetical protein MAM1_0027c02184 [Mucor ambiguus]
MAHSSASRLYVGWFLDQRFASVETTRSGESLVTDSVLIRRHIHPRPLKAGVPDILRSSEMVQACPPKTTLYSMSVNGGNAMRVGAI